MTGGEAVEGLMDDGRSEADQIGSHEEFGHPAMPELVMVGQTAKDNRRTHSNSNNDTFVAAISSEINTGFL
ncbi:hypothetical protein IGS68_08730 [Skermanella sp. TT6]|uniref:Uncharacterized protein n=1 Tax=Skermanella cutis TaxID=2775420 RepID=A0ABX7BAR3_9PROT|nr:hypothetical protein [Skermanella sp. TT6]QQP91272.1 hypothetical protein IGS68_08730 [Skermanella sp. TT6]